MEMQHTWRITDSTGSDPERDKTDKMQQSNMNRGSQPPASKPQSAPVSLNTPPDTPATLNPPPATRPVAPQNASNSLANKPVACVRCKTKKIKCDGKTPACSGCARAREECVIQDMVTKRTYRRGYVEELENRVSELQSLVDTRNREIKENQSRQGSVSVFTESSINSDIFQSEKRISSASTQLTLSENSPSPPENGPDGDLALSRLLVQTLHLKDHGPCISKLSLLVSFDSSALTPTSSKLVDLPSREHTQALLLSYFETECRCFPFIQRSEIEGLFVKVYQLQGYDATFPPTDEDYFRFFLVLAIASISSTVTPGDEQQSASSMAYLFYNTALSHGGNLSSMVSGVDAVQNLLLLALFCLNARVALDAWRLSRRAMNICVQEQYHIKIRPRTPLGEDEARQAAFELSLKARVFWSAYCINRITSNLLYDRPPCIMEEEIDIEIPSEAEVGESMINPSDTYSMEVEPDSAQSPVSLLPFLVRIYHLSTTAFCAFNTSPPNGGIFEKLNEYLLQFLNGREEIRAALGERGSAPLYLDLSLDCHMALMCQWASSALFRSTDGIPIDVRNVSINLCIETLQTLVDYVANVEKSANSRMTFIILLRILFILASSLIIPVAPASGAEFLNDLYETPSVEDLDLAISRSFEALYDFGNRFGHGNSYLQALALAIRFGLLKQEYPEFYNTWQSLPPITPRGDDYNSEDETMADAPLLAPTPIRPDQETLAASTLHTPPQDSHTHFTKMVKDYTRCNRLFINISIRDIPLNLDLPSLHDLQPSIPPQSFKKFGPAAHDLHVLSKQVIWRLRVQAGLANADGSLQAFETRLGVNRPVQPFPQIGAASGFNTVTTFDPGLGDSSGKGKSVLRETMDATDPAYQPLADFEAWPSPPKMDVDFSGFETNINVYR